MIKILYPPAPEKGAKVLPPTKPSLVRSHAPTVSITYTVAQEFPNVVYGLPSRALTIAPSTVESADDIVSAAEAPL